MTTESNLSSIFNNVSRLPAVQYEHAMNMTGIAQYYQLPQDIQADELECFIRAASPGPLVTGLMRELEALNPALRKIPYNKKDDIANYRVAMGVVSAINIDDISYFMRSMSHGGAPARNSRKKNPTKAMIAFIEADDRPRMKWAPSRKTLEKICQRIRRKESEAKRAASPPSQSPPA